MPLTPPLSPPPSEDRASSRAGDEPVLCRRPRLPSETAGRRARCRCAWPPLSSGCWWSPPAAAAASEPPRPEADNSSYDASDGASGSGRGTDTAAAAATAALSVACSSSGSATTDGCSVSDSRPGPRAAAEWERERRDGVPGPLVAPVTIGAPSPPGPPNSCRTVKRRLRGSGTGGTPESTGPVAAVAVVLPPWLESARPRRRKERLLRAEVAAVRPLLVAVE